MELHVVQLIDCRHRFDVVFFLFIAFIDQIGENIFLLILSSFARPLVKTMIVKFRLLPRKASISGISLTFFY